MTTVLLYRTRRRLADPAGVGLWQRELGRRLGVTGQVAVSPQGMRGSICGSPEQLADYASATQQHPALVDLRFRCGAGDVVAPAVLEVRVTEELVGFEALTDLWVDAPEPAGGRALTPRQVYAVVAAHSADAVALDDLAPYASDLGRCEACGAGTSTCRDCVAPLCLGQAVLCNGCADFALCAAHRN